MNKDNAWRKRRPIVTGCLDYFPDALLEVAHLSWVGNQKHNPGEPLHWARGKSMDQADTTVRHLMERGGFDYYEITNERGEKETVKVRHSVAVAWRALANLQEELEREEGCPMSRGSWAPGEKGFPAETKVVKTDLRSAGSDAFADRNMVGS